MSTTKILAIETSCDDTSIAVVEAEEKRGQKIPEFRVLKNLVSSQTAIHSHWGGVVPSLAKREHLKNLPKIYKALSLRGVGGDEAISKQPIDLIAVTVGPGLEPSLWTGIEFAKKLSTHFSIPLVGANHLEGHLYSFLLSKAVPPPVRERYSLKSANRRIEVLPIFPAISLLVSGGHTILTLMKSLGSWKKLGETRDDAVGEAYDKVAKMMGLPYPGGPIIEELARKGDPKAIHFPRPMINTKDYDFSFSGLKTAVLYYLRDRESSLRGAQATKRSLIKKVAASFQAAAIETLVAKTMRAAREFGAKSITLAGGVAANIALREALAISADEIGAKFFAPETEYNTDNAAMIAVAAYMRSKSRKKKYPLEADSNLSL